MGESETSGIFCCYLGVFFPSSYTDGSSFQTTTTWFPFLRIQSYWCSLSCQKKKKSPFYPSGSNLEIRFKLLVAVLSLPGEGREGGCQTSRAAVREGHPLPEIQMWAARSWPNYCCSLHPTDTQHFPSPGRPSSTTSKEQTKPRR